MCHRVGVLCDGELMGIRDTSETDFDELGRMMSGERCRGRQRAGKIIQKRRRDRMRKIRLQKRANVPTGRRVLNSILFVALALVFCGVFLAIVGFNPSRCMRKCGRPFFPSGDCSGVLWPGCP